MDKMTSVFKIQHSTLLSFSLVWDNEIRFTVPRALKTSPQIQYLHARKQTVIYAKTEADKDIFRKDVETNEQ